MKITIELEQVMWETLSDAIADVACWHYGFASAKPDYDAPPQVRDLIDMGTIIKGKLRDAYKC